MSSADASPHPEPPLAPEEVAERTFPNAFRGFDPVAVRAFLGQVADDLRAAQAREAELRSALEAVEATGGAVADADAGSGGAAALAAAREEAERVNAAAREEADSVLETARAEADRLVREAKERVTQLGNAATAESARVISEAQANAQQLVRSKGDEAEAVAVKKIADAEREAAAIRVKAREDADAILEAAKERGREMVAEAQAARERLIADITKRKRAATGQLDQLRTGRDRLLESLRVVRRNLDEITTRLEATEGSSPPVAATPGDQAPTGEPAPPDRSSDVRRAARASRVMLGELPAGRGNAPGEPPAVAEAGAAPSPPVNVRTVTTTTTPRTDAPQADAGPAVEPAAARTGGPAGGEGVAPQPAEERRSSALRILRRRQPAVRPQTAAVPTQVGRDSSGEGIRIIGKAADEPEPSSTAAPAPPADEASKNPPADVVPTAERVDAAAEVGAARVAQEDEPATTDADALLAEVVDVQSVEREVESNADAPVDIDEGAAVSVTDATDAAAVEVAPQVEAQVQQVPEVGDDELPPPLLPEEVRPRIEDLFARIRADREEATAKARRVLASSDPAAVAAEAPDGEPTGEGESASAGASDADEHALQARDVVIEPVVAQLTKRLKRAIQDEQNATLDRLRTARPRPAAADILAGADLQPAPYRYTALPMLEQVARAAAAAAPFGAVAVGVDDLAQALADDLAGQIRLRVDRVLADASGEDLDLQSTSERVSAVYREWKTQRVERVAMHYLVTAWSRGTFVATPEGTPMRWIVDDDGPCPDCDDNVLAGPTPRGQSFPTGQLHPPAHVGCRCLFVPAAG